MSTMTGYDLDMIHKAATVLSVPLIVSGGCGSLQHAIDALEAGVSAVAISSMFLFTDNSPIKLRSRSDKSRATKSVVPPAVNATTSRIGRMG